MSMLQQIVTYARQYHAEGIFLNGDVIDKKNDTPLEVILALWHFFASFEDVPVWWIRGNHESPEKDACEKSIMSVFRDVGSLHVVLRPEVVVLGGTAFYLLPYYPAPQFKAWALRLAGMQSTNKGQTAVLLAHVGLREGYVSAQTQIESEVALADLQPQQYSQVLLGDFHMHQQVGPNAWYTGAPIPHTFGDENIKGVWLYDTVRNTRTALKIEAPRFDRWNVQSEPVTLPGFDPANYNEIKAPKNLQAAVHAVYPASPGLRIVGDGLATEVTFSEQSRMTRKMGKEELLDRYLTHIGKEGPEADAAFDVGMDLIEEFESKQR